MFKASSISEMNTSLEPIVLLFKYYFSVIHIVAFYTQVLSFMRLLGTTETYTKDGYLVIKPHVKDVLRCVGGIVYDSNGRRVGVAVDVIGRVDDPRIVVKLDHRDLGELLLARKERLYYTTPTRKKSR